MKERKTQTITMERQDFALANPIGFDLLETSLVDLAGNGRQSGCLITREWQNSLELVDKTARNLLRSRDLDDGEKTLLYNRLFQYFQMVRCVAGGNLNELPAVEKSVGWPDFYTLGELAAARNGRAVGVLRDMEAVASAKFDGALGITVAPLGIFSKLGVAWLDVLPAVDLKKVVELRNKRANDLNLINPEKTFRWPMLSPLLAIPLNLTGRDRDRAMLSAANLLSEYAGFGITPDEVHLRMGYADDGKKQSPSTRYHSFDLVKSGRIYEATGPVEGSVFLGDKRVIRAIADIDVYGAPISVLFPNGTEEPILFGSGGGKVKMTPENRRAVTIDPLLRGLTAGAEWKFKKIRDAGDRYCQELADAGCDRPTIELAFISARTWELMAMASFAGVVQKRVLDNIAGEFGENIWR